MKSVYWRPRAVSRTALTMIALLSVAGWLAVEYQFHHHLVKQKGEKRKMRAADLATRCMQEVKHQRILHGHPIDPEVDPTESGLIGVAMSSATSVPGVLSAKQTTINPNFAAVVIDMLEQAGVQEGDTVAVGYSGSFPALNICVDAALETMKANVIDVSSAAASQWGANIPNFLWLDMEKSLFEKKLITNTPDRRTTWASIGGVEDRGVGMDDLTLQTLQAGIDRSGFQQVESAGTFKESVDQRMKIYKKGAGDSRIQVYINVGGGTTSVGKSLGKRLLHTGLNTKIPLEARKIDSVMTRFLNEGVPVIHLIRIRDIAKHYGLEIAPRSMPDEGLGTPFLRHEYNPWLTGGVLAAILLSLYLFIRSDWGFRIFQTGGRAKGDLHPEPMV